MSRQDNSSKTDALPFLASTLTVFLGLQLLRAGLSYFPFLLRDRLGWSTLQAGLFASAIFAIAFLAGPLQKLIGTRRLLLFSGLLTGMSRLLAQLWRLDPLGDMVIVLTGIASFLIFLPVAAGSALDKTNSRSTLFAVGILSGVALDLVLNGLLFTYDQIWQEGLWQVASVFALVVVQMWLVARAAGQTRQAMDPPIQSALSWTAIGPFLFLELLQFANIAWLASETNWPFEAAYFWLLLAQAAGLALWYLPGNFAGAVYGFAWLAAIASLALQLTGRSEVWIFAIYALVGQVALAGSLLVTLRFLARHAIEPGLRHLSVAGGFGMLMMVSLLFAYYAAYDIALPIPNSFLPAIALLIVAALTFQAQRFAWSTRVRLGSPARALTSLLLLAMVCPVLLASGRGMPAPPASTNGQVRVMSYNLHNGFNPLGQLDLESLAQTIEAAHVDVVGLQEVSRGWAINGSVDMFTWLAHRLQMNAVFGPTAGSQWGNAVLTRLPITSWENQPLPGEGLLLQRGYLRVELSASDGKPLTILNTHYHNPENGSLVRQEQSEAILAVASELTKFMITGDLNAQPGSEEIEMLRRTELRDVLDIAGETPGYTNPVPEPWRRIDYVWVSEDWIIIDAGVPYTAASDHLPVTAILE